MKPFDVIVSVGVELELVVEAENEADARAEAVALVNEEGIQSALRAAESISFTEPDVVDVWELDEEELEKDE